MSASFAPPLRSRCASCSRFFHALNSASQLGLSPIRVRRAPSNESTFPKAIADSVGLLAVLPPPALGADAIR
jgi:hypothetical protein